MATNLQVCSIDPELSAKLRTLRFQKGRKNTALIAKIVPEKCLVILDEEYEDISVDDLREELPEHFPRYIVYSYIYTHDDGRISYPLVFIFISPSGTKPELHMMYAGTKLSFQNEGGFSKVFELRDVEELTEEWLNSKLAFFY